MSAVWRIFVPSRNYHTHIAEKGLAVPQKTEQNEITYSAELELYLLVLVDSNIAEGYVDRKWTTGNFLN